MIVIKGNLILRQAQNRIYSETSSEQMEVVAYATLEDKDISKATVIVGDTILETVNDTVLVTGEVTYGSE